MVLSAHHTTSLPYGYLKILQDRGQCWIGSSSPLETLLNASLQRSQLLLRAPTVSTTEKMAFLDFFLYYRNKQENAFFEMTICADKIDVVKTKFLYHTYF